MVDRLVLFSCVVGSLVVTFVWCTIADVLTTVPSTVIGCSCIETMASVVIIIPTRIMVIITWNHVGRAGGSAGSLWCLYFALCHPLFPYQAII